MAVICAPTDRPNLRNHNRLLAMTPLELQRHIINTLAGRDRMERLGWLCRGYLIAALAIGSLKYIVNIKSAGLGEATIRSLRENIFSNSSPLRTNQTFGETIGDRSGRSSPWLCRAFCKYLLCWSVIGSAAAVPVLLSLTHLMRDWPAAETHFSSV